MYVAYQTGLVRVYIVVVVRDSGRVAQAIVQDHSHVHLWYCTTKYTQRTQEQVRVKHVHRILHQHNTSQHCCLLSTVYTTTDSSSLRCVGDTSDVMDR